MRNTWIALAAVALAAPAAPAQAPALPDPAGLDRLNLRTEWAAFVPVAAGRDGFGTVQVADETQIFVQTRAGLLVALDALTGAKQWAYRYPAQFVVQYPVGWNDEFVFAVNVSRLLAFHRRTGVVAFDFELPGSATAGPAADKELVYVTLNGTKVVGYRFPPALLAPTRREGPGQARPAANAADVVADRYTTPGAAAGGLADEPFEASRVRFDRSTDVGLGSGQRSPSISSLPSVTPPYTLDNRGLFGTPSVTAIASMRQPYRFRPDFLRYNQQTPSVTVLPASAARVNELANFAPRGIQPTVVWTHPARNRIGGPPVVTDREADSGKPDGAVRRVWLTTDGADVEALDRRTGRSVITAPLQARIATRMVGPVALAPDRVLGLVGLTDGNVVAVDLLRGGDTGPKTDWRASVGGLMNHAPVATTDSVFASGSQSGVSRLDMATGDVVWKTADPAADRVLAVNDEFVYVRDRRGDLLVFDRRSPAGRPAEPLARLPVAGFTVPVSNDSTDRVLLANDSGIMVSLRDASAKYARPARLIPPVPAAAAKAAALPPEPKKDAAPAPAPKKEPEPKKDGEKINADRLPG